jgi:hypothetical protein
MANEKLDDYLGNPAYERKIVAFYDTLGWRAKIAAAGSDQKKIGDLRRQILGHQRLYRTRANDVGALEIRFSSFSDNVVMSLPLSQMNLFNLLGGLGCMVLEAATQGFLMRGGITIGDIVHDDESVFGPGLNRAYELEKDMADYPRIVIDEVIAKEFEQLPFFVSTEHGWRFIDPFSFDFLKLVAKIEKPIPEEFFEKSGLPPTGLSTPYRDIPHDKILRESLQGLKPYLKEPLSDKDWRRFSWLYDRIAKRIGVPPASSYPRVSD